MTPRAKNELVMDTWVAQSAKVWDHSTYSWPTLMVFVRFWVIPSHTVPAVPFTCKIVCHVFGHVDTSIRRCRNFGAHAEPRASVRCPGARARRCQWGSLQTWLDNSPWKDVKRWNSQLIQLPEGTLVTTVGINSSEWISRYPRWLRTTQPSENGVVVEKAQKGGDYSTLFNYSFVKANIRSVIRISQFTALIHRWLEGSILITIIAMNAIMEYSDSHSD